MATAANVRSAGSAAFNRVERQIQTRMGIAPERSAFLATYVRDAMPDQHRDFFPQLPFVYMAMNDESSRPSAGMIAGDVGFMSSPEPTKLCIDFNAVAKSTFPIAAFKPGTVIGMLGMQHHTRRRNRVNGVVESNDDGVVTIAVRQSFGNCPKYINKRAVGVDRARPGFPAAAPRQTSDGCLNAAMRNFVREADTFFIASSTQTATEAEDGNAAGCDVSHRGGAPGFVQVAADGTSLRWPDFVGNNFFMTLGNISDNKAVSLLFVDYENGSTMNIQGVAWDKKDLPGAQREIEFRVESAEMCPAGAWPLTSGPVYEFSPFNPEQ